MRLTTLLFLVACASAPAPRLPRGKVGKPQVDRAAGQPPLAEGPLRTQEDAGGRRLGGESVARVGEEEQVGRADADAALHGD